jgi:hypothetical protein
MNLLTLCCGGVGLAIMASAGAPTFSDRRETVAHARDIGDTGITGVGNRGGSGGQGGTGGGPFLSSDLRWDLGLPLADRHESGKR